MNFASLSGTKGRIVHAMNGGHTFCGMSAGNYQPDIGPATCGYCLCVLRKIQRTARKVHDADEMSDLPLSLAARSGFHFCESCEKATEDVGGDQRRKCKHCGSHRVTYFPATLSDEVPA